MGCSGGKPVTAPPVIFTDVTAAGSPPQRQPQHADDNSMAAAAIALTTQQALHDAASAAPASVKEVVASGWHGGDEPAAGPLMERILTHVDLLDANYLVALGESGGMLPRWQAVPDCAKINAHNVWRLRSWSIGFSCPVLCVSYAHNRDREHPDKHGGLLRSLLPLLKLLIAEAAVFGEHCTIGVLWDYASLPQEPRTQAEQERFDKAVPLFNSAFAHPYTFVLLCTQQMPLQPAYASRGWCRLETRVASLVKDSRNLWDFALFDATGTKCVDLTTARRYMKAFRPPFVSPARFATEIRDGIASGDIEFSVAADAELAVGLYESTFARAFETFVPAHGQGRTSDMIFYKDLQWTDEDAPLLAEALAYAVEHCDLSAISRLSLNFRENEFTAAGKALLEEAAKAQPKLMIRVHVADEPQF